MFSYEYRHGYGKYRAKFYDDWKRLDYCMAATYDDYHYSNQNALSHEIKTHDFYLVSYGTPIATVRYMYDISDGHIITTRIKVNANSWNCSRSTIQQLSRWLRYLDYQRGISIPYSKLKEMMMLIEKHGYRSGESVFPSGSGFSVIPYDHYELMGLFQLKCPFWNVELC